MYCSSCKKLLVANVCEDCSLLEDVRVAECFTEWDTDILNDDLRAAEEIDWNDTIDVFADKFETTQSETKKTSKIYFYLFNLFDLSRNQQLMVNIH